MSRDQAGVLVQPSSSHIHNQRHGACRCNGEGADLLRGHFYMRLAAMVGQCSPSINLPKSFASHLNPANECNSTRLDAPKMRLRLTVQRNSLPAANVLWNVSDTNSTQAYTVTRLLEDINHVIPLEAEHWGLEHYIVEVGGFECLHFSPVVQALKDDDHVSIRPLMTAEVRARTLTGRHQISDDGRHLVDGVPFGRPYLRHPNRPAVRIPPRKRRRLDDAEEDSEEVGLITANGEFSPIGGKYGLLTNGDTGVGSEKQSRASKTVQFHDTTFDEDEDSEEEDDDFAPDAEQDDDVVMDDSDDSDSDSDSDSSSDSDTSPSDSDSDDSSTDSDSDSDSDSDASAPPKVQSSKAASDPTKTRKKPPSSPQHVAPGHGLSGTRKRNARRTKTARLRRLKEDGKLPPEANLEALDQYENGLLSQPSPQPEPSKPFNTYAGKRKRIDDEESEETTNDTIELELRKQELMARLGQDTADTMVQMEESVQETVAAPAPSSPRTITEGAQAERKETPKKRLRPDTSAISRILARQAMVCYSSRQRDPQS